MKWIVLWTFMQIVPANKPISYDDWGNVIQSFTLGNTCRQIPVRRYEIFDSSTVAKAFFNDKTKHQNHIIGVLSAQSVKLYEMKFIEGTR